MSKSQTVIYKILSGLLKVLGLIPQKFAFKLGDILGHILFLADSKHRNIALNNLTRAFGNEKTLDEIKQLAGQVFKNFSRIIFELAWSTGLDSRDFNKYFQVKGLANFKSAFKKNKGVLVVTAHIGNWELLPIIATMTGKEINVVFRPLDFLPLNRLLINLRTRFGLRLISFRHSMREMLRCLKKNEGVVVLIDQNVDWYEGSFVDFFNHRACTNRGPALLALKTEAPVVPLFLVREGDGFKSEFLPEIPLIKTGDKTKDIEENTRQYNKIIESIIRKYPEQWFWIHQRWKTKPYCTWPRNEEK
jgi:KDO2-lipid IV(A) lauroyltransferase